MPHITFPINEQTPDLHPYMLELPEENWTLCKRVAGTGDVYLPMFKRVIREGEKWYLPAEEANARPDWEVIEGQKDSVKE